MGHFPAGEPLLVSLAVLLLAGPSTLADSAQQFRPGTQAELVTGSGLSLVADKLCHALCRRAASVAR